MDLNTLRKEYSKYEKTFKLPPFREINEIFEIEKIEHDSECILRVVRKVMMDKIVNSLGFLDMLMNPMQAPKLYHAFIKSMGQEDKQLIEKLYDSFGRLSFACMPLELEYSEKNEASMIKSIFSTWNGARDDFRALLIKVGSPQQTATRKEKSYYG